MKTRIISLHIVPKSAKNEIVGWTLGAEGQKALKIKVAAAPEDGKANAELLKFLAREWQAPKTALELASGDKSRHKRLKIHDDKLAARLTESVTKA